MECMRHRALVVRCDRRTNCTRSLLNQQLSLSIGTTIVPTQLHTPPPTPPLYLFTGLVVLPYQMLASISPLDHIYCEGTNPLLNINIEELFYILYFIQ